MRPLSNNRRALHLHSGTITTPATSPSAAQLFVVKSGKFESELLSGTSTAAGGQILETRAHIHIAVPTRLPPPWTHKFRCKCPFEGTRASQSKIGRNLQD
eukprot:1158005-Pelagomonas_calceolata.AAC.1